MATLHKNIKKIIVPIFVGIDRLLVCLHIVKPRIVIYVDGGLCSQMNMWIHGQYYTEHGFDVYYDLDWYRRNGKGIDGVTIRHYEFEKLWPYLPVRTMSRLATLFYRYLLPWSESHCMLPLAKDIQRSVYFTGYNRLPEQVKIHLYRNYFSYDAAYKTDKMILDGRKRYCGVHVRRGDLASVSTSYYPQVTDGYFLRAIKYVQEHCNVDEFLLFSEDSQWLRNNIIPNVNTRCQIMEGNTALEDLMLLAQCQIIIASQGSFGPTAALINQKCELLIRNGRVSDIPYAQRELQIE